MIYLTRIVIKLVMYYIGCDNINASYNSDAKFQLNILLVISVFQVQSSFVSLKFSRFLSFKYNFLQIFKIYTVYYQFHITYSF